jgi:hypothetical protein
VTGKCEKNHYGNHENDRDYPHHLQGSERDRSSRGRCQLVQVRWRRMRCFQRDCPY